MSLMTGNLNVVILVDKMQQSSSCRDEENHLRKQTVTPLSFFISLKGLNRVIKQGNIK